MNPLMLLLFDYSENLKKKNVKELDYQLIHLILVYSDLQLMHNSNGESLLNYFLHDIGIS